MYADLYKCSMKSDWDNGVFITVDQKEVRAAKKPKMHWHDYFTVEIITEGNAVQYTPSGKRDVHKGYFNLVLPSEIHCLRAKDRYKTTFVRFGASVLPEDLEKLLSASCRHADLDEEELSIVNAIALAIGRDDYDEKIRLNLLESLLLILQSHINDAPWSPKKDFKKVLDFIDTEFRSDPTLEQAAAVGAYNPSYFSHLFKKVTGQTYLRYLTQKKLDYACALMYQDDISLSEIAAASGFSSFSGFSRSFKAILGVTPTEYRANQEKRE